MNGQGEQTASSGSNGKISSYRDLIAWQLGMTLAKDVYKKTTGFPREEIYGLLSQIRRAGSSIPANIAEGWGRGSTGDYLRFLRTARGSLFELETHVLLARDLTFLPAATADELTTNMTECARVLNALIMSVEKWTRPQEK